MNNKKRDSKKDKLTNHLLHYFLFKKESDYINSVNINKISKEDINEIYEQINELFFIENDFDYKPVPQRLIQKALFFHQRKKIDKVNYIKNLSKIKQEIQAGFKKEPSISILWQVKNLKIVRDVFSSTKYQTRYFSHKSSERENIKEEFIFFNENLKIFIFPNFNIKKFDLRISIINSEIKTVHLYTKKKMIGAFHNQNKIEVKNMDLQKYAISTEKSSIFIDLKEADLTEKYLDENK